MIRRARVLAIAAGAIVLAIPLLPGPGVSIIMAALADVHEAFGRESAAGGAAAGFPPARPDAPDHEPLQRLADERDVAGGRRVA